LRRAVVEHVDVLERFHGRMTACHVVVRAPDRRHRSGGLFDINIHLVLPGGVEVNIDRLPSLDERFADPLFAVGDAFRRARRQIQDRIRRQRGDVKSHRPRAPRSTARRKTASREE
jgi:hypothetical protein